MFGTQTRPSNIRTYGNILLRNAKTFCENTGNAARLSGEIQ